MTNVALLSLGLQFLTLGACGISDDTLKRIRFLELRYLDVGGNRKVC